MTFDDLLGGPPPTLLPSDDAPAGREAAGDTPESVAAAYPASPLAWATLAEKALADGCDLEGYAYARVGYHRGLDALRRSGWKGHGPVPWSHKPNRGFLRCLAALADASARIDEQDEAQRCLGFLTDCDPEAPLSAASS